MTKMEFIETAKRAFEAKHGLRLLGEKPRKNPQQPHGGLKCHITQSMLKLKRA